jgi:hypothetical protein
VRVLRSYRIVVYLFSLTVATGRWLVVSRELDYCTKECSRQSDENIHSFGANVHRSLGTERGHTYCTPGGRNMFFIVCTVMNAQGFKLSTEYNLLRVLPFVVRTPKNLDCSLVHFQHCNCIPVFGAVRPREGPLILYPIEWCDMFSVSCS